MNKLKSLSHLIDLKGKEFSTKDGVSEIELLHAGEWQHPSYGTIRITDDDVDKFVQSFNNRVRKVDIAVDQEHMPEKGAAGWFKEVKKVFEDDKTKLKASVKWTKLGKELISNGIFKYFSPEFDFDYEDMETHEMFENVLLGGALTNRPYFKSLAPVALSETMFATFNNYHSTKGGNKMNKDELKAKLAEDSEFVLAEEASDEEKALYEEVKTELAKEAEDTKGDDAAEVKASEKFIAREDHIKQMNELKSKLGIVEAKLRKEEVTKQVDSLVFSESNADGVLLPKNKKAAVELLMSANPKVAKLFNEFVEGLPKVSAKLFKEEGVEGEKPETSELEQKAEEIMEKQGLTYSEALKVASRE
jgi:phage I-like protein